MRMDPCKQCGGEPTYNSRWDSFWCKNCDIWTEPHCNCDPTECEFRMRPDRPSYENK